MKKNKKELNQEQTMMLIFKDCRTGIIEETTVSDLTTIKALKYQIFEMLCRVIEQKHKIEYEPTKKDCKF